MTSSREIVAEIIAELQPLGVRSRAMFGGYTIYCDDKVVALFCDDRLFLKPTPAADSVADDLEWCPPYPGARDFLVLDDRFRSNRPRVRRLIQATADALAVPKPKKARRARKK